MVSASAWHNYLHSTINFKYVPIYTGCDILDINNIEKSFELCQENGPFFRDNWVFVPVVKDKNVTLLPKLIEQTPNATGAILTDLNLTSLNGIDICKWKNLTVLDVSFNMLRKLPSHLLPECHTLFRLFVSDNIITKVDTHAFAGLSSLSILILAGNQIETLHRDIFKSLIDLEELYLQYNRIRVIDSDLFRYNKELQILNLGNNKIISVSYKSFYMLKKLHILRIHANSNLMNINLRDMDMLSVVNVSNCSLETLFIPTNVDYIDANYNQISHIIVEPKSRLKILELAFNKFTNLSELQSLVNLKCLDLSNNDIRNIKSTNFFGLNKLINLRVNFIHAKDVNVIEIVENLPALQQFNISSDNISTERAIRIQKDAKKSNIFIEVYYDEKTKFNVISFIKP